MLTNIKKYLISGSLFTLASMPIAAIFNAVAAVSLDNENNLSCPLYTTPHHAPYDADFFGKVVTEKPITLLSDSDHEDSNMYAVLADEGVMKAWAKSHVTDLYLEVGPYMHARIAPFIEPFNKESIKKEFETYFTERGLYTVPGWANLRSSYLADMIEHATKYGVAYHFISKNDPFMNDPQFENYKKETRIKAKYCDANSAKSEYMAFFKSLGSNPGQYFKFKEILFDQRMSSDRERADYIRAHNGGGRLVVVFGDAHFLPQKQDNMRDFLGRDNTLVVGQSALNGPQELDRRLWEWKSFQSSDYTYFFGSGFHAPALN